MFGKAPDGAPSVEGKMGGAEGFGAAAAAASCGVAGNIYQIVEMTGSDGKKLLKLLPAETLRNSGPSIHVPVLSDNTKVNDSASDLVSLKTVFTKSTTVLSNTVTSPLVKIPALLTEAPGKLILKKTSDNVELVKVTNVSENQTITSSSTIQNNYVSANKLPLQKDAASVSSVKSNILVNTQNLPVLNSSVLPSGHHLQIHSYAKVQSVPASCLSPAIQHKILPVAATNASVTLEAAKPPNVIYVSPVNIVKTPISKCMQNINPTPAAEIVKPLVLTSAQTAAGNSVPDTLLCNSQKPREGPMKWVVQENPESSASCLVPVRSSNDMVSKILKTLFDRKNVQNNPASALPACSSNLSESQTEFSSVKDNALVMYNGKVFLLARKGSNTDSAPDDRQVSATADTDFRKHTSQVTSLDGGNTITRQVVNLVLSKNKGVALSAKDPKSCENVKLPLWSEWNKTLIVEPSLTSPHDNLQISSISQQKTVSASENTPVGMKVDNKTATEEGLNVNIIPTTLSPKTVGLQSSTSGVSKEEEQKIEKINSTKKTFQIEQMKVLHRKKYAEMRNKFGLLKEERVYLTRLSLFNSVIKAEETEWSSNVHTNDSCKLLQTITEEPDPEEEEMILGKQESNLKREAELSEPMQENSKRMKTLGSSLDSTLVTDNPSSFCGQVISQQENPTDSLPFSSNGDSDPDTCMQSNEDSEALCPTLHNIEHEISFSAGSLREDSFLSSPPDLEEIIKDEKIERLKLLLKRQEAALEEMRKKLQES